jgi:RimJ/RimL family protein N-acetyltransferase
MEDEVLFAFIEMNPMNETEIEEWLERDAYVRFTSPDQPLFLAVTRNDTGHAIGWAALHIEPRLRRQATLNMMIDRKHQRNGFGSEAMGGVLEFCFKGVHLHRVAISCDGRNAAAARMAEKAGLRYEAQFVEDRPNGDAWTDTLWFAMLEREYPSAGKKSEADSAEINATR